MLRHTRTVLRDFEGFLAPRLHSVMDENYQNGVLKIRPEIQSLDNRNVENYIIEALLFNKAKQSVFETPLKRDLASILGEWYPRLDNVPGSTYYRYL